MVSKADGHGAEAPPEHHQGAEAEVEGNESTETEATHVVQAQCHGAQRYYIDCPVLFLTVAELTCRRLSLKGSQRTSMKAISVKYLARTA